MSEDQTLPQAACWFSMGLETRKEDDGMSKFRKKPVAVEAMQWDGGIEGAYDICMWSRSPALQYSSVEGLTIKTLEGVMTASEGDWIIKGVKGEFYPCKPDIFAATYEQVGPDEVGEQVRSEASQSQ